MSFPEPGLALRFLVTIDSENLGFWTKCEGLVVEYSVHEYKEGGQNGLAHKLPGRATYQNLKLTRPVDSDSTLVAGWLASIQGMVAPKTVEANPIRRSSATPPIAPSIDNVRLWRVVRGAPR